jgi:diguanylate cyclase
MDILGMGPGHEPLAVLGSILLAAFASFVTLDLARRVRTPDRSVARFWWAAGSLAMGTGIWAMHFVGMLGLHLGFPLGYRTATTLVSWVAAMAASGIALRIAGHERLTPATWAWGSFSMAGGICGMHYIGMAALELQPGIEWHVPLVLLSALIALAASAVALGLFFWMRRFAGRQARLVQIAAAGVMGLAISGMHYTGMAAAGIVDGAVCLSVDGLGGPGLGLMVGGAAVLMLTVTMLTSLHDARMQAREASLASSLQTANAQLQSANEELKRLAFQDALTGLPNRMLFEDRLEQAAARLDRAPRRSPVQQARLALLFIDLDGFKPVNDSYGHAVGDQVLMEVAGRLRGIARQSDTVARIGGDEFVVLVEGIASPADAAATAQRVLAAMQQPFKLGSREIGISCSIGIALYPDQAAFDRLLASADAAMYTVKRAGGGSYAFFEATMSADVGDQMALQQQLRHAIERNELHLQYQPKLVTSTGELDGVEALLRWQHPDRGLVPPAVFIPVAERFGLIVALGNWVIEQACAQLAAWNRQGRRMRVAINLSAFQLRQADLVARIAAALERHGVAPRQLICEITETVAMEDTAITQQVLEGLAGVGVIVSIDDFGTGYSSLAYLRQLPARQLKIDRSFVKDLGASDDARAVVDAVIRLAHALGLEVVAEGVETEIQHHLLASMGCDLVQGFLHARPMKPEALLAWLDERAEARALPA